MSGRLRFHKQAVFGTRLEKLRNSLFAAGAVTNPETVFYVIVMSRTEFFFSVPVLPLVSRGGRFVLTDKPARDRSTPVGAEEDTATGTVGITAERPTW